LVLLSLCDQGRQRAFPTELKDETGALIAKKVMNSETTTGRRGDAAGLMR